ncbi:hypothetical protein [Flammeovirga kamogawensis]|uniref:DUF4252 domain-containing protein n=1 Tax=Flammeovirga kamogawensis TaxID=373891 RepID=A0ABX8GTV4_9BACT|nr:hypothetical protein [Flammeovirga kamogawensis]MBB6459917.1 hypothetical protein [Flammeovirga kamogawensis]QWG07030.1 hypothetical protein KM029_17270 [Flammeovirga kamogawensis]TRX68851.1 hypothetical protein EO216_12255 [Flammeovirga kamogawensis]
MKKLGIIVLVAFIGLVSFKSIAQKGDPKKRAEAKKEINAYMKANMLPVMLENRKEFDTKLSKKEKATLVSLRERLEALKTKKNSLMKDKPSGEPSEEQKNEMKAMKTEMRHIMTDAWVIVDNHESDLEAIKTANKANEEKWKADMKAIFEKYKSENSEMGKKGKHGKKGHHFGKMDDKKPVMFVLMDPSKTVDQLATEMEQRQDQRGHRGGKGHHGNRH